MDPLPSQSPSGMPRNENPPDRFTCCCGRPHCPHSEYNNKVLEGLELDLRTAAQVGQVCLIIAWLRLLSWLLFLARMSKILRLVLSAGAIFPRSPW